jgi:hypothetical protein
MEIGRVRTGVGAKFYVLLYWLVQNDTCMKLFWFECNGHLLLISFVVYMLVHCDVRNYYMPYCLWVLIYIIVVSLLCIYLYADSLFHGLYM